MRIKLTGRYAHPGGNHAPGSTITVSDEVAQHLIESKQASPSGRPDDRRDAKQGEAESAETRRRPRG